MRSVSASGGRDFIRPFFRTFKFCGSARGNILKLGALFIQRLQRISRVGVQRPFARDILFGLRDTLAQTLRVFARACFFGIQRIALDDQSMQRRRLLGFGLAQRRQMRCKLRPVR